MVTKLKDVDSPEGHYHLNVGVGNLHAPFLNMWIYLLHH